MTRTLLLWLAAAAGLAAVFGFPAEALAGTCYAAADCAGGNAGGAMCAAGGVAAVCAAAVIGLDGGFTGNGDGVDFTAGDHGAPPAPDVPPPKIDPTMEA